MTFDKCLILVTIFQLSSGSIGNGPVHLDLNEINLVQYDVRIEDQPIIVDNVDSDSPAVQVKREIFLYFLKKYMYRMMKELVQSYNNEHCRENVCASENAIFHHCL